MHIVRCFTFCPYPGGLRVLFMKRSFSWAIPLSLSLFAPTKPSISSSPPSPWIDSQTPVLEIFPRSPSLDGWSGLSTRRRRRRGEEGSITTATRRSEKIRRGVHDVCRSLREEVFFHFRRTPYPAAGLQESPLLCRLILPHPFPPPLAVSDLQPFGSRWLRRGSDCAG